MGSRDDVIVGTDVRFALRTVMATRGSSGGEYSETTDSQGDLSLSCSVSPFESEISSEEETGGALEPYQFEPVASSSGGASDAESVASDGDNGRLESTDW